MSCINCGRKGHAASECRQAKVEKSDRPCFTCGKTGHEARMCPNKPAQRAPLKALEDVPRRVATLCVTDADGFTKVPPRRAGQRLGDFIASTPKPRCNSNRFRQLSLEDWQHVAAEVDEASKSPSSEAVRMPTSTSNMFFPLFRGLHRFLRPCRLLLRVARGRRLQVVPIRSCIQCHVSKILLLHSIIFQKKPVVDM